MPCFGVVVACFENLNFLKVVKEAIGFESIISMITSLSKGPGKNLVVLKIIVEMFFQPF
jgi:hypothetical protein